jgi:CheY-like chemotaxis protein
MSTVLIVDDEPDILLTLRMILRSAGHVIIEASDGMTALEQAKQMPDVMLLDIRLPDIDGLEVLRRLKADEELSSIPVLCISAHSSPSTKQLAIDLGAAGYIGKPFVAAHLREEVARHIA